jgi:hypothetical protein
MPRPAVLVAAALTLGAPACGGGDAREARGGRIAVVLDDFSLAPQDIRAPAGRVRMAVANRGRVNHTLAVEGEAQLARSLEPGARGALAADLAPGAYRLRCVIGNHEELGMWGTLTVR